MKASRFLLTLLVLAGNGCAPFQVNKGAEEVTDPIPIDSVELFLARGSLLKDEFEQYRLSGGTLFFECGEVRRGRAVPLDHDILDLPPDRLAAITRAAHTLLRLQGRVAGIPPPGVGTGFSDPGRLELRLSSAGAHVAIVTSIGWVTDSDGAGPESVKSFAAQLRESAQPPDRCGNTTFYGIPLGH